MPHYHTELPSQDTVTGWLIAQLWVIQRLDYAREISSRAWFRSPSCKILLVYCGGAGGCMSRRPLHLRRTQPKQSEKTEIREKVWGHKESNLGPKVWNLRCYHYTIAPLQWLHCSPGAPISPIQTTNRPITRPISWLSSPCLPPPPSETCPRLNTNMLVSPAWAGLLLLPICCFLAVRLYPHKILHVTSRSQIKRWQTRGAWIMHACG